MGCDNKEEEQHGLLVENNIEDNEEQHDPRLFHNKSAESWFGNKRPTPIIGALLFFILVSILGNIGLLTRTHSPRQTLATRYGKIHRFKLNSIHVLKIQSWPSKCNRDNI